QRIVDLLGLGGSRRFACWLQSASSRLRHRHDCASQERPIAPMRTTKSIPYRRGCPINPLLAHSACDREFGVAASFVLILLSHHANTRAAPRHAHASQPHPFPRREGARRQVPVPALHPWAALCLRETGCRRDGAEGNSYGPAVYLLDTPPGRKPHGCSLHHSGLAHCSTRDLPGP